MVKERSFRKVLQLNIHGFFCVTYCKGVTKSNFPGIEISNEYAYHFYFYYALPIKRILSIETDDKRKVVATKKASRNVDVSLRNTQKSRILSLVSARSKQFQ